VWQCSHHTSSGLKYMSIILPLEYPFVSVLSSIRTSVSLMLKCSSCGFARTFSSSNLLRVSFMNSALLL